MLNIAIATKVNYIILNSEKWQLYMTHNPQTQESPQELTLAQGFNKYFKVCVADTPALREEAFKIRHDVYCEELGWEGLKANGFETDEYDNYSYHVVLKHNASGTYAGSVRIVIPPAAHPQLHTPFEDHCLSSLKPDLVSMDKYPKGSFGEVSRIAVPRWFRRRPNEAEHPYIINKVSESHHLSAEERRHFPNIAIGLYLSAVAMSKICQHSAMFVMVEPRLSRHLKRVGLPFEQVGDVIEYHGSRALFRLQAQDYSRALKYEVKELFDVIERDLRKQMTLIPYWQPTTP